MTQEDWTKMNKESHYNSLIKQDLAHRELIKKLQLERDELKKQLKLYGVVGQSEQLKAFADYAQKRMWEDGDKDLSEFVDEFLSL